MPPFIYKNTIFLRRSFSKRCKNAHNAVIRFLQRDFGSGDIWKEEQANWMRHGDDGSAWRAAKASRDQDSPARSEGLMFFGGQHHLVHLPLSPPFFLIILFVSTTLLTGMTGISLHVQWPLIFSRMAVFSKRTMYYNLREREKKMSENFFFAKSFVVGFKKSAKLSLVRHNKKNYIM
jgi:hypothetical protein